MILKITQKRENQVAVHDEKNNLLRRFKTKDNLMYPRSGGTRRAVANKVSNRLAL